MKLIISTEEAETIIRDYYCLDDSSSVTITPPTTETVVSDVTETRKQEVERVTQEINNHLNDNEIRCAIQKLQIYAGYTVRDAKYVIDYAWEQFMEHVKVHGEYPSAGCMLRA